MDNHDFILIVSFSHTKSYKGLEHIWTPYQQYMYGLVGVRHLLSWRAAYVMSRRLLLGVMFCK